MKRTALKTQLVASLLTLAFAGNFTISTAQAASMNQDSVMVGGQSMLPSKDIIDNAVNSADHTTPRLAAARSSLIRPRAGCSARPWCWRSALNRKAARRPVNRPGRCCTKVRWRICRPDPPLARQRLQSSRRTISAPALSALSLPWATCRGNGAMPQLVHGYSLSASTNCSALRKVLATSSGVSMV